MSTYHDDSNESKLYLDHNNLSHSLIPSPSFPSSILSTSSIEHKTHEFNKTQKKYQEDKVPKPRLYYPLQHQQGVWLHSRLRQYCPQYPGITFNHSTSSLSSDDQSSAEASSSSYTSISRSELPVMLCLPITTTNKTTTSNIQSNNNTVSQYRNSFLSSSHLQSLFTTVTYDSIIQSPVILYPINTSTSSCKLLQDEPTMSKNNHQ